MQQSAGSLCWPMALRDPSQALTPGRVSTALAVSNLLSGQRATDFPDYLFFQPHTCETETRGNIQTHIQSYKLLSIKDVICYEHTIMIVIVIIII